MTGGYIVLLCFWSPREGWLECVALFFPWKWSFLSCKGQICSAEGLSKGQLYLQPLIAFNGTIWHYCVNRTANIISDIFVRIGTINIDWAERGPATFGQLSPRCFVPQRTFDLIYEHAHSGWWNTHKNMTFTTFLIHCQPQVSTFPKGACPRPLLASKCLRALLPPAPPSFRMLTRSAAPGPS